MADGQPPLPQVPPPQAPATPPVDGKDICRNVRISASSFTEFYKQMVPLSTFLAAAAFAAASTFTYPDPDKTSYPQAGIRHLELFRRAAYFTALFFVASSIWNALGAGIAASVAKYAELYEATTESHIQKLKNSERLLSWWILIGGFLLLGGLGSFLGALYLAALIQQADLGLAVFPTWVIFPAVVIPAGLAVWLLSIYLV